MAESVVISGVSRSFGRADTVLAVLQGVNLTIDPGEFLAILGPSGCGKSTLLRMIAGLDRPTSGTVRLGSEPVTDVDPRCAVVFQEPRLLPWRTVTGNVELGQRGQKDGLSPRGILERVGLAGFDDAYPHQLSGGMAQRAALARALIGRPEVLLLDEPFAALDALTRIQMQDLLVETFRMPRPTVVMVTHDVDEALRLADRIVILGHRPAAVTATFHVPAGVPGSAERDVAIARMRAEILHHFGLSPSHLVLEPGEAVA
jgi:ABC-type nitrate/sulfonate/bicarbonate transport system ATPase subunit